MWWQLSSTRDRNQGSIISLVSSVTQKPEGWLELIGNTKIKVAKRCIYIIYLLKCPPSQSETNQLSQNWMINIPQILAVKKCSFLPALALTEYLSVSPQKCSSLPQSGTQDVEIHLRLNSWRFMSGLLVPPALAPALLFLYTTSKEKLYLVF